MNDDNWDNDTGGDLCQYFVDWKDYHVFEILKYKVHKST